MISGEYTIQYELYTMFDVYKVNIKNHNLITLEGYDFFFKKWYIEENYPISLGFYHDNKFYANKSILDTYSDELSVNGVYSRDVNYIDKSTNKQYRFDGENFVDFIEKLDKICIGKGNYVNDEVSKPSEKDTELYLPVNEYEIEDFEVKSDKLVIKCTMENIYLDGTTEIGVKTNHGRLVTHDIHAPYNLPFTANIVLEYVFNL